MQHENEIDFISERLEDWLESDDQPILVLGVMDGVEVTLERVDE